jgi:ADP-ribose pyrophosphatase YjhB (NUDIX family)
VSDVAREPRKYTRIGAYTVCLDDDRRILLCRIRPGYTIAYDGYWTLPGGGIDHGEDPRDAAIRELFEETGLHGALQELLDVESNHAVLTNGRGEEVDFHGIRIIYRAAITGGTLTNEPEGSTDLCRWFSLDELRTERRVDLLDHTLRLVYGSWP